MGSLNLEPIIELFIEESNGLLEELETIKMEAIERGAYTNEDIIEIFRITHTIKADATMVLFENIAGLLRTFEKLLYFLRDEDGGDVPVGSFTELLTKVQVFVESEVKKVAEGKEPDLDSKALCEEVLKYLSTVKNVAEDAGHGDSYIDQVFYIPSKAEGAEGEKKDTDTPDIKDNPEKVEKKKKGNKALYDMMQRAGQNYSISDESMNALYDISRDFADYIEEFNIAGKSKLGTIYHNFIDWIDREYISDFTPIKIKTEKVIDEMRKRTGKKVELEISGVETKLEKYKVLIIAEAMVHIVRNSVDHGIGTASERADLGKSEAGHLTIAIDRDEARSEVVVTVADDGRGVSLNKVLDRAERQNLLTKARGEYTEDEILKLLFLPGLSTLDDAGVYSGRGVGMDVVRNNVEEIGGRIKMINEAGEGFSISLIVPTSV